MDLAKEHTLIPVCPEQMGGLTTPRLPSERQNGAYPILMKDGTDVTENYLRGVEMALNIAKINGVKTAILKAGSPSCGKGLIYDGTFTGKKVPGNGVTTELFTRVGIKVYSDEEL